MQKKSSFSPIKPSFPDDPIVIESLRSHKEKSNLLKIKLSGKKLKLKNEEN